MKINHTFPIIQKIYGWKKQVRKTYLSEDLEEFKKLMDRLHNSLSHCPNPREGDYAEFVDEGDPENSPIRICDKNGRLKIWIPDFETYDAIKKEAKQYKDYRKEYKK